MLRPSVSSPLRRRPATRAVCGFWPTPCQTLAWISISSWSSKRSSSGRSLARGACSVQCFDSIDRSEEGALSLGGKFIIIPNPYNKPWRGLPLAGAPSPCAFLASAPSQDGTKTLQEVMGTTRTSSRTSTRPTVATPATEAPGRAPGTQRCAIRSHIYMRRYCSDHARAPWVPS
jgi:hypothetical protein